MNKTEEILQIISDITSQPIEHLRENQDKVGLWDSFNTVEIVFALEEKFGITFSQDDIASLTTISAIISKVEK